MSAATSWGVTAGEQHDRYPCDDLVAPPARRLLRGVDVAAPPDVVYRWLCQLRAAPYSYDLVDNRGRRSPRAPLPWCWELEVGQTVCVIFTLESFGRDEHLTMRTTPRGTRLFGDVALTYRVTGVAPGRSRLVAAVRTPAPTTVAGRLGSWLLGWGDLVMMRKQLRTLAWLAAREVSRQPSV